MNRTICKNGHYYDADQYSVCPHCAVGMAPAKGNYFDMLSAQAQTAEPEPKKKSFLGFMKKENGGDDPKKRRGLARPDDNDPVTSHLNGTGDIYTVHLEEGGGSAGPLNGSEVTMHVEDPSELDGSQLTQHTDEEELMNQALEAAKAREAEEIRAAEARRAEEERRIEEERRAAEERRLAEAQRREVIVEEKQPVKQAASNYSSLQSDLVRAADARKNHADEGKTVGYYSTATEPPVGYLVCTKGEDFGKGFLLKAGNNTVGRSQSMDVAIVDTSVSREKQAYIMYEPKKREFFIRPGEGSALCYHNDQLLMMPEKLEAYDKITIGNTDFLLIPVCCEKFSWDDVQ